MELLAGESGGTLLRVCGGFFGLVLIIGIFLRAAVIRIDFVLSTYTWYYIPLKLCKCCDRKTVQ